MDGITLYKRLARTNCGECAQGKCLAFALAVVKGDAELQDCPHLSSSEIEELIPEIRKTDWREELISKLRAEVGKIDFGSIAEGLGARIQNSRLLINCLGREFVILPDGTIESDGRLTPCISILLLHYIRTGGRSPLSGKWVSYRDLKGGLVKISSFERECEDPFRELFDRDTAGISLLIEKLGAEKQKGFDTEYAWRISLLPKVPVLILYWPPDEEFGSKLKLLFDSTADEFLDAESLMCLTEGLLRNIEAILGRS
jgi:hypothetical protein